MSAEGTTAWATLCDDERIPNFANMTANNSGPTSGFTPKELRKLRGMKNPYGIQKFLDDMPYHLEDTAWSPREVLAQEALHLLEGAIFAAAALRAHRCST